MHHPQCELPQTCMHIHTHAHTYMYKYLLLFCGTEGGKDEKERQEKGIYTTHY